MPLLRLTLPTLLGPTIISALCTSVFILFSSTNWPTTWCFFELNIILFILILTLDNSNTNSIAMTTYFLAQAIGSTFLLLGALTLLYHPNSPYQFSSLLLITTGILVNTAAAPFQQWYITTIPHINWISILVLSTAQNLAPLLLLTNTLIVTQNTFSLTYTIIILSLIIGALGILNSSHLNPLIAFSSLHHLGWIISGVSTSATQSTHLYIFTYIMVSCPLLILLNSLTTHSTASLNTILYPSKPLTWLLTTLILTLAGLPPFPLFFINLIILSNTAINSPLLVIVLLTSSAISSLSYLRFALTFILSQQFPQTLPRNPNT